MPPIFLHMAVARDLAHEIVSLRYGEEPERRGAYLLGATSPDVRVITRWEREKTHYFDLNRLDHQDSIEAFFEANPALRDPGVLTAETVGFVAGYLSHLALDEAWILDIYRPYFGQRSALGGNAMANTMDRILQYELDRRERLNAESTNEIQEALANCSLAIDVGFLDSETLKRWLEVATDQANLGADWERFRRQAQRHLRDRGVETVADWERFRERIPELLQQTIDHVSTAQVDAFLEQGRDKARQSIESYLGVRA